MFDELCRRLRAAGIPLARAAMFVRPLHPNVASRAFYWREGDPAVEITNQGHDFIGSDEQLSSPIHVVTRTRAAIRRRLCDAATPRDYPRRAKVSRAFLWTFLRLSP